MLSFAGVRYADRSKTNFEFSTGGGVRYYVADNWGIRPEVRGVHQPPEFHSGFSRGLLRHRCGLAVSHTQKQQILSPPATSAIVIQMNGWASISARDSDSKDELQSELNIALALRGGDCAQASSEACTGRVQDRRNLE